MKLYVSCLALLLAALCGVTAVAQDKTLKAESSVLLSGLDNPCGVAVQPGTGIVFVSDSGAGKIVRIDPAKGGKAEDVITDFPKDVYGKGPKYNIGPLGLAFIDKDTLVVGGGGQPDGSELVRIYTVPAAGKTIKADAMKHSLGPIKPGDKSVKGEGNFYGVAVTPTAIYLTCNGDDTKGWVSRIPLKDGKPGALEPFIATKGATEVDAPVGIAINRHGHIVIGQMGEITKPGDSLLTFYSAKTGKKLMNLETGLFDIAALSYSPIGRLYAIDFAWMDTKKGGMFRLDDDGKGAVTPNKVLSLDKASAIAFAPDGTAYVTVFGTAKEGSKEKSGQLLKVTGDL